MQLDQRLKESNEKMRTENETLKEKLRKDIKEKDGRAKEVVKVNTTVRKMKQELETPKVNTQSSRDTTHGSSRKETPINDKLKKHPYNSDIKQ